MKKFIRQLAHFFLAMLMAFTVSRVAFAGEDSAILKAIKTNTDNILVQINNLPTYVKPLTEMAVSWLNRDATDEQKNVIAANGVLFSSLSVMNQFDFDSQTNLAKNFGTKFLGQGEQPTTLVAPDPATLNAMSLIGQKVLPPPPMSPFPGMNQDRPDPAKEYLKFASGANVSLIPPNANWGGSIADRQSYQEFYNTLAAIQSYNAYVVSRLYAERESHDFVYPDGIPGRSTGARGSTQDLLTVIKGAATSPSWYTMVRTEPLGMVLRHLLLFTSQSFVTMQRMTQLQEEMLTSQAMMNTLLLVTANQSAGAFALQKARQGMPKMPT